MSAWTTEKPTTEGWYWYRIDPLDKDPITDYVSEEDIQNDETADGEWQPVEPAKE